MIYSVTVGNPRAEYAARVQAAFPNQHYLVFDGQPRTYLVFAPGLTSHAVMVKLGADAGFDGHCLVTGVSGYNGWHRPDLWEWIKTRGQS